ncbi:pseudouridine synthase [Xylariaceae sp. FL0662B]|nr:pseudouridine synthase [Xylariaceae sp. FL0662B]
MATHTAMAQGSDASVRSSVEQRIGILHYASEKEHGWYGQIRTRFTDFQVHEISKDGEVVHLHDFPLNARDLAKTTSRQPITKPGTGQASQVGKSNPAADRNDTIVGNNESTTKPEQPMNREDSSTPISPSDQTSLADLLGQNVTGELVDLYSKASQDKVQLKSLAVVKIPAISDKTQRSRVHSEVRRVFGGKIDTFTEADGSIKATAVGVSKQRWGNRQGNERSRNNRRNPDQADEGQFLHFSLYKENRDTIDAINQIARLLNLKPSFFGTAGTKDRRAVTVQRVSMRRRNPQTLVFINNDRIYGVKIGDFKFEQHPIHLGSHNGNEFVIVVKNCSFSGTDGLSFDQKLEIAKSTVNSALEQITQNGFINYYGTQRFGTHQIGTQEVGMKILKQDFEGAVSALLSFNPALLDTSEADQVARTQREDAARARACSVFSNTGDAQAALRYLPRRCNVESSLMRHLGRHPKDHIGALLSISRGMRSMYVHAYQSLVWNFAASKRWELFGSQVVKGDLVLVKTGNSTGWGDPDENDEEIIHLVEGGAITEDTPGLKVHALTDEEVGSGKYSIFDIVLPTPGWDVVYPNNEIGPFYSDFMAREENGGLNPQDMLRRQRDFSLPGTYRKLMGKFISTPSATVQAYSNDTEQLVPTDLDLIRSRKAKEEAERKAAQPDTKGVASAWQSFVDNVRENELKESQARIERRKAEDLSGLPEHRVRDTWIQTSLDGSHKRIKVAQHTDEVKTENENKISQSAGDTMLVDEQVLHQENNAGQAGVDEPVMVEGTQSICENGKNSLSGRQSPDKPMDDLPEGTKSTSRDNKDTKFSIVSMITGQVRFIATRLLHAIQRVVAALRMFTNKSSMKTVRNDSSTESQPEEVPKGAVETTSNNSNDNGSQQAVTDQLTHPAGNPGPQNAMADATTRVDEPTRSADAVDDGLPTVQRQHSISPVTTNDKKIAVILRFTLDTSQYATIVLRELQGVASPSDNTAALSNASAFPKEDVTDSS